MFPLTFCSAVFPACDVTLDGKRPSQVVVLYNRLVSFQVRFRSMACCGVMSGFLTTTDWRMPPDNTVSVYDRGGVRMTRHRQTRQNGFQQSHGWDQESGRVGEISNMFHILLTHHDKPGNYN